MRAPKLLVLNRANAIAQYMRPSAPSSSHSVQRLTATGPRLRVSRRRSIDA